MEREALVDFLKTLNIVDNAAGYSQQIIRAFLETELPQHWLLGVDPDTNVVFFFNSQTGEQTAVHPNPAKLTKVTLDQVQ